MIAIVLGTRPEIIKVSPVIRACEEKDIEYFTLHTGQHYSYEMDRVFFDELELPLPKHNLDVGSGSHAEQTGKIMLGVEKVLLEEKPNIVLVQGDTNTVMAGALATTKLHIKVGHVEAGLRSYDRSMPEEINRVVADHVSDYLFAPTETAKENLLKEGIEERKITVTGNTIVDAVHQNLLIAKKKGDVLGPLGLKPKEYILVTAHRQENVDDKVKLKGILDGLTLVGEKLSLPVIFPIHPRTEKMIKHFGFSLNSTRIIKPTGFLEFLQLESSAKLVLTDSGGIQEEACILGVPCVTLRENTERPETVAVGANVLAGTNSNLICKKAVTMADTTPYWKQPFGDGHAGRMIAQIAQSV